MAALLAVIALQWAAIAYLLFDARRERDVYARVLAEFVKQADRERQTLLQRIQAPEVAVRDHSDAQMQPAEDQPWLGWDEDPETGMTKEELAEALDGRDN